MTGLRPISTIARDLGAPEIKDGRCAAWYRGGSNPRSLKLDDDKGAWYDFGKQRGGGIIDLVMLALGCDRRGAVDWLRQRYGLAKPDAAMRSRREAIRPAALSLAEWRWGLVQGLRAVRNCAWDAWNEAETLYRGLERVGDLPATEWRRLRQRLKLADGIDRYINHLQSLSTPDLLALRQRLEGQ